MGPKLLYVNPETAVEDKKCTCSSKKQDSKFLLVPVSSPMEESEISVVWAAQKTQHCFQGELAKPHALVLPTTLLL